MVRINSKNIVPNDYVKVRFSEMIPKVSSFAWEYYPVMFFDWIHRKQFLHKLDKCDFIYWDGEILTSELTSELEIYVKEKTIDVLRFMGEKYSEILPPYVRRHTKVSFKDSNV